MLLASEIILRTTEHSVALTGWGWFIIIMIVAALFAI